MRRSNFIAAALISIGASILLLAPVATAQKNDGKAAPPQKQAAKRAAVPRVLLEERRDAARDVFEQSLQRMQVAEFLPGELAQWSERWLEAELALSDKPVDRTAALEANLERTRQVEEIAAKYAESGVGRTSDARAASYYRLNAEIRLHQEPAM